MPLPNLYIFILIYVFSYVAFFPLCGVQLSQLSRVVVQFCIQKGTVCVLSTGSILCSVLNSGFYVVMFVPFMCKLTVIISYTQCFSNALKRFLFQRVLQCPLCLLWSNLNFLRILYSVVVSKMRIQQRNNRTAVFI